MLPARRLLPLFAVLSATCAMAAPPNRPEIEKYPSFTIGNGELTLHLFRPDPEHGYYRGSRFDWSGIIGRAEYGGHQFYGEWRGPHNPANHDDITGPCDEFGQPPLAWAETAVGQPFIKIGIGLVRKTEDGPYHFATEAPLVNGGKWRVTHRERSAEFVQELKDDRGWGYRYTKRVEAAPKGGGFSISHTLANTGTKPIDQNQYCHNFTSIDDAPIGPAYRVTLPFAAPAVKSLGQEAQVEGNAITFSAPIKPGGSVQGLLQGWGSTAADNAFTVENTESGAGVRMRGDTPVIKYNFWSAPSAACPEPFIQIHLAAGEKKTWVNRYELFVTQK